MQYAGIPDDGSVAVLGLGPIGDMACRIAMQLNAEQVIGLDLVPERLARAQARGATTIDLSSAAYPVELVKEMTGGRGPDSVIDAVGMEAHGMSFGKLAQTMASFMPDAVAARLIKKAGIDRMGALLLAIELVRRGGTISLSGVYGGQADPMPMMTLFDKQIQLRMGQDNVKHWIDDVMPFVEDESDPLGLEGFATHHLPFDQAPEAYAMFQQKQDGAVKVLLRP